LRELRARQLVTEKKRGDREKMRGKRGRNEERKKGKEGGTRE
jgi:hypothetical protein